MAVLPCALLASLALLGAIRHTTTSSSSSQSSSNSPPPLLALDFAKSPFRLRAHVTVEYEHQRGEDEKNARFRYSFEEAHSSAQRRTKLAYSALGGRRAAWLERELIPASGTVIMDGEAGALLVSHLDQDSTTSKACQDLTKANLRRLSLNGPLEGLAQDLPQLLGGRGPSAALLLVQRFREQLKRVAGALSPSVRNTPSVMFGLEGVHKFQLYSFYAMEELSSGGAGWQLPLRVVLYIPDPGLQLEYDFLQFEQLAEGGVDYMMMHFADPSEIQTDEWAIPRATGCSALVSAIAKFDADQKLAWSNSNQPGRSFSFTARVPESFASPGSQLVRVAYQAGLNVLRVDSDSSAADGGGGGNSRLLVDFNLGTTQHVLERGAASGRDSPALDQVLTPTHLSNGGDSRSCILVESGRRPSVDFAQLLTGAPSARFLYLGRARVRGTWTRAYEAYNTTWPGWLQQPVTYTTRASRAPQVHEALASGELVLSTVIYLAAAQQDESGDQGRLVQLEVVRMRNETKQVVDRVVIQLHDFSWLPSRADLSSFSLAGECAPLASEQRGRVALSLASKRQDRAPPVWLAEAHLRDLALLEALQGQLGLPASSLMASADSGDSQSPLSSRLVVVGGAERPRAAKLEASFGFVSSAQRSLARLQLCGWGRPKKLYQFGGKLARLERSSLQACFYLAAHRKRDTFLGYSRAASLCLIDLGPDPIMPMGENDGHYGAWTGGEPELRPRAFELSHPDDETIQVASNTMDVYFVSHREERNPSDLLARLHHAAGFTTMGPPGGDRGGWVGVAESQLMRELALQNPAPDAADPREPPHVFLVRELQFLELSHNDRQPFAVDDVALASTNKFPGFALVPDGVLAVEVAAPEIVVDLEGCRAACLASSGLSNAGPGSPCKAYSLCLHGSAFQCVLSSVDFRAGSQLLLQLLDIQQQQPLARVRGHGERRTHRLRANATNEVRVRSGQRDCELHNKLYLDLFQGARARASLTRFGSLKPVDGRDQCAQRCFKATLRALNEADHLRQATKLDIEQLFRDGAERLTEPKLAEILTGHRTAAARQMCREFYYLDGVNLANLPERLRAQYHLSLERLAADDQAQGYCLMAANQASAVHGHAVHDQNLLVDLERFSLRFELLFEGTKSVRLLATKRTPAELEAYRVLASRRIPANMYELEPLWGLLNGRKNSQVNAVMSHMDAASCAQMCATQVAGPWPACRSFDLLVMASRSGTSSALCLMNSVTRQDLLDTGQQALVVNHSDSLTHLQWHYEPRFGSSGPRDSLRSNGSAIGSLPGEVFMAQRAMYLGMPSTFILSICLIGSITGIVMGLNLGLGYLERQRERESLLSNEMTAQSGLDYNNDNHEDYTLSIESSSLAVTGANVNFRPR